MYDVLELISRTKAEVRPYQERIVNKVLDCYSNKAMRSILIDSPTGSGKTILALFITKAMHELFNARIGWVAMRRNLLSQAQAENVSKEFNIPITFISMFDKSPPTGLDMLVVDEAQHDVTGSMAHIHALIEPKWILGMTATPFRADRVKLCFDSVIKDAGIAALIKEGYLSQYHHYTIKEWTPEIVVDHYTKDEERWGKSIMFFHRLEQCYQARKLLEQCGISSDVVSGSTDVEAQLEAFRKGELKVLINCMKLTEGLDCPSIKTVFARPSCRSVTIQMCGRVFRKHPDLPIKQIVQAQKSPYVFTKTALPVLQHVLIGDAWRTLEVNPNIDRVNQRAIHALAQTQTELPTYIKKANQKGVRWSWRRVNGQATPRDLEPAADLMGAADRDEMTPNRPDPIFDHG